MPKSSIKKKLKKKTQINYKQDQKIGSNSYFEFLSLKLFWVYKTYLSGVMEIAFSDIYAY